MSSAGDSAPISVTIFGDRYRIRSDRGEAYTRACAEYVDDAIQRAHRAGVAEPRRAAILAALEITDGLLQARRQVEELTEAVETRVTAVAERLESMASGPSSELRGQSRGQSRGESESGEAGGSLP